MMLLHVCLSLVSINQSPRMSPHHMSAGRLLGLLLWGGVDGVGGDEASHREHVNSDHLRRL